MAELRALDIETLEDDAGRLTGSDCGNLLARLPAAARDGCDASDGQRAWTPSRSRCCSAPTSTPFRRRLRSSRCSARGSGRTPTRASSAPTTRPPWSCCWRSPGRCTQAGSPVDLELLFTVGEERSLAGASVFDVGRLRSRVGFVFDHASPIGEVIERSPGHFRLEARFRGAAAHAGIRPEDGRSAIVAASRAVAALPHRAGWTSRPRSTSARSPAAGRSTWFPTRCSFTAEVRSLDQQRAEQLVAEVVERIQDAAHMPDCDCDVDVSVEQTFAGYRQPAGARAIGVAEAALRRCGHEPRRIASGGGSDANALIAAGLDCVNLANGTQRPHEPGESVADEALSEMLEVALALVEQSLALEPAVAALAWPRDAEAPLRHGGRGARGRRALRT